MAHDRLRSCIITGLLTVTAAIGGCGSSIDMPGVLINRSIVNVIADDSQSAQVADLRRQWTESWGCALP